LNAKERYLFDLQGFLVVKNVLKPEQLKQLNDMIDAKQAASTAPWTSILEEQLCRDLIDDSVIAPYMLDFLGDEYRLDHEYPIISRRGAPILKLHGGSNPYDTTMYYQVMHGRIHSGLTVVSYALTDLGEHDGGFCCIPGSHKSEFPLPEEYRDFSDIGPTVHIPQKAGDVLIFSEALTHGTFAWQADHERRSLLYKYSPAGIAWQPYNRTQELLDTLSVKQKSIVSPPASLDYRIHFAPKETNQQSSHM
jgi:hypothetical protein